MNTRSNGPGSDSMVSSAGPCRISMLSAYGLAAIRRRAMARCSSLMSQVMIRPPGGSVSAIDSAE